MAKIIIDLKDKPILDIADEGDPDADKNGLKPAKDGQGKVITMTSTLIQMLKTATSADAVKHLDWCFDLRREGKIEVDNADFDYLQKFVKDNSASWALVKGQLLRALSKAKELSEAKKEAPAAA